MKMSPVKLLGLFLIAMFGMGVTGCAGGGAEQEASTTQQVAPPPPTNLVATPQSAQTIALNWDPVPGATFYVILKGMAPGTETTFTSNSPATATTFLDDHDTPNTQYCFEVVVFVDGSGASGPSNEQCVTTLGGPQPPTGVQATTLSATEIGVSWNPVDAALGYYVFESVSGGPFNLIGSVAAPGVTLPAAGLTPATTYSFAIETFAPGAILSALSAPATATTFGAGLEGYYRFDERTGSTALDSSGWGRNGTLQGGAALTTADQAPLKDPTDHNPSSVSLATSTANVSMVGSIHFDTSDTSLSMWIKLTSAPIGPVSFIGRRAAGCGPIQWQLGQDATNGLNFTGASPVGFGQSLPVGTWTQVAVVLQAGVLTMYVNGAPVSTGAFAVGSAIAPSIQIGDVGGCGNGAAFLVDEVKLFSRALSGAEVAALGTAPPAPTNLVATSIQSTSVSLSWSAVPGADHYFVYRGSAPGNEVFFTSNPGTTFVGDHLSPGQTTSWQVLAISAAGLMSPRSNELVVTTSGAPAPPTGLTATLDTCCTPQRVDLAWNAVPGAIAYHVFQSTSASGPFVQLATVVPPATTFQVAGLSSGTTYFFEVDDEDSGFTTSAPSAPVSARVP